MRCRGCGAASVPLGLNTLASADIHTWWNDLSEMTSQAAGTTSVTYAYDGFGRRVIAQPGGPGQSGTPAPTFYIYDGDLLLGEVQPTTSGGASVQAAYTWGVDGPVSERLVAAGRSLWYAFGPQGPTLFRPAIRWQVGIHSGETRELTDATGAVADTYVYTAYGVPVSTTGSDYNPFRFGGQFGYYTDGGPSAALLCGVRWYEPSVGRFLSRDPEGLAAGQNMLAYCGNDPVNLADPLGTIAIPVPRRYHGGGGGAAPDWWLRGAGDFFAGWGDTLSFGLCKVGRRYLGGALGIGDANEAVDYNSGFYAVGEGVGTVHSILLGGGIGWEGAGARVRGETEFSHWIPERFFKRINAPGWLRYGFGRSKFNGNFVSLTRHFMQDPFRYPSGWRELGSRFPTVLQQLDRVPRVYYGAGAGALYAGGHDIFGGN